MAALANRGSPNSGGHSSSARFEVMIIAPCFYAAVIALPDHFVEVEGFIAPQRLEAQFVDDQQGGTGKAQQLFVIAVVSSGRPQLGQELLRTGKQDRGPCSTRP